MRPARPLPVVLLPALALSLAACSGAPNARVWAATVCTTLTPWRTEIGSLTGRAQQQMDVNTTPGQAKENLTRLFSGAQQASEQARAGVAKAGVPDVHDGKQHKIKVSVDVNGDGVNDDKEFVIQARQVYNAPKPDAAPKP